MPPTWQWDKIALRLSGWLREGQIRCARRTSRYDGERYHISFIKLYLMYLQDGSQVLARISFPFPHRVRTGDEFAYQEGHDRARIPYRLQSEVCYLTLECIASLRCHETR